MAKGEKTVLDIVKDVAGFVSLKLEHVEVPIATFAPVAPKELAPAN